MSLQVWLPLNGDLHNQGLMPMTFSTTTANWNAAGKIGQAFSTLNSNVVGTCPNLNGVTTFSLTFWCFPKTNSSITTNWCNIIALGSKSADNSTSAEFRFESSYGNTYILSHHNNSGDPIGGGALLASERDKWYHVAVVANNESHTIRYYVNGVQLTTSSFLITHNGGHLDGTIKLANESVDPDCLLNDVRIYDHALSAKEVEEIAKGLVLHYKLDDTYSETSTFLSSSITDTAYNSQGSKYGYNETSNLAKTIGFFQGKNCVKISTITANQNAQPYSYFGNLFTSNGTNSPAYKALSFDYFTTVPTTTWLNIYKLGNGTGTATWTTYSSTAGTRSGTYTNSSNSILVQPNEWNHIEIVFHGTTDADAQWGYCINGPVHVSNENYYFLYANIQLEENDHTTGYGANMHSTTIYDSSGYGNNGTIIGSLETVNDSSRYNCATKFNGSSAIKVNDNNWMVQGASDLTVNIWAYMDNWSNWNGHRLYSCTESGGFNIENTIANSLTFPVCVYTNTAHSATGYIPTESRVAILKTDLTSGWHMFTYIYTETECQCYLDGVLYQTKPYTSYGVYFNINGSRLFLGCEANGVNPYSPYFIGQESDFRIYYTALTSEQIKELYNTSMSIDNNGNIHVRELVEL